MFPEAEYVAVTAAQNENEGDSQGATPTKSVVDKATQKKTLPDSMPGENEGIKVTTEQNDSDESIKVEDESEIPLRKSPPVATTVASPCRWADKESESSEERAGLLDGEPIPSRVVQYEDLNMPSAVGKIVMHQQHEMSNLTMPYEIATPSTVSRLEPANLASSFQHARGKTMASTMRKTESST
jgi:hypothetical protein